MNTEDGYQYDDASPEMQAALERARGGGELPVDDLDALEAALEASGGADEVRPGAPSVNMPAEAGVAQEGSEMAAADALKVDLPPAAPEPTPVPEEPWAAIKHGLQENDRRPPPPSAMAEKMKAVGWEPKPKSATAVAGRPDWAQLQAELAAAERSADTTRSAQAVVAGAGTGNVYHPYQGAGQGDVDAARGDIALNEKLLSESRLQEQAAEQKKRDALEQQRLQQQIDQQKLAADTAAKAKLVAEAKEQARNDPNSPESQKARAALAPIFQMVGEMPEGFDSWSAADVEKHASALRPVATGAASRKKIDAEVGAKEADRTAMLASLEAEKDTLAADKRVRAMGITREMMKPMDRHALDELRDQLGKVKPTGGGPAKAIKSLDDITDPGDRAKVQAIGEGRADLTIAGLKDRGRIASMVMQAYPGFDQTKFGAYKAVTTKQATSQDIVAARTALDHFKHARTNLPTANFDAPMANRLRKAILFGTGSAEMTPFEVDVKVAADEYAKALGNNAQAGRQEVEHLFSSAQSPEQLVHALDEAERLLDSKIHEWKVQMDNVKPTTTGGEQKDHGAVVKETKSFKQYADGFIEKKKAE